MIFSTNQNVTLKFKSEGGEGGGGGVRGFWCELQS